MLPHQLTLLLRRKVVDQPTPTDRDDDNATDLSSLFDEAAAQPPPSIDSVDRAQLIRLQQANADLKNLFDLVDREEHPYTYGSGVLVRAWRDKLSPHEATYHQVVVPTVLRRSCCLSRTTFQLPATLELLRRRIVFFATFTGRSSTRM